MQMQQSSEDSRNVQVISVCGPQAKTRHRCKWQFNNCNGFARKLWKPLCDSIPFSIPSQLLDCCCCRCSICGDCLCLACLFWFEYSYSKWLLYGEGNFVYKWTRFSSITRIYNARTHTHTYTHINLHAYARKHALTHICMLVRTHPCTRDWDKVGRHIILILITHIWKKLSFDRRC